MLRALVLLCFVVAGCAPSLTLRRLARPQVALGDVRSLSVAVGIEGATQTFSDKTPIAERLEARLVTALKGSRLAPCERAPCGDGALTVTLREVTFDAPMTERPERVLGFTAQLTFTPSAGPSRTSTHKFSMIAARDRDPDAVMAEHLDRFAKEYVESLSPRAPLATLELAACEGCNPGIERLHRAEWSAAADAFRALTAEHPELAGAWFNLGVALEAQGLFRAALDAYKKAAERDPASRPASSSVSALESMLRG